MQEARCKKCGKLLYKYEEPQPKIEIKCPRCGEMNTKKESVENEDRKYR